MPEVANYHQELSNRILPIVEKLIKGNSLYQTKLNKEEIIKMLIELFGELSLEEMRAITEYELTRRIDKVLVLEAVSGTLNDLTPEQIKMYDEAVKRK
ncbi:MAG: hypothetical protein V7L22_04925 [Nostoc sp.]|uniref:hypothetical protein n=1 Tax=Nostoc sp. TaxID=1180 RepID=UPI002FF8CBA6